MLNYRIRTKKNNIITLWLTKFNTFEFWLALWVFYLTKKGKFQWFLVKDYYINFNNLAITHLCIKQYSIIDINCCNFSENRYI